MYFLYEQVVVQLQRRGISYFKSTADHKKIVHSTTHNTSFPTTTSYPLPLKKMKLAQNQASYSMVRCFLQFLFGVVRFNEMVP
jgi:hypothetical protein